MSHSIKMEQKEVLKAKLKGLKIEHRDLDEAIHALSDKPAPDMLMLSRMKRRKLMLKDQITRIEDELTPDIIA